MSENAASSSTLTHRFAVPPLPQAGEGCYRNSGIMTFIVGKDGVIYQKDLGEKTTDVAVGMAEYNPGDGWNPAI